MIGTQIADRYQINRELGKGGMGVVYHAHDTLLNRDVAVKILSETELTAEGRERLLNEARAAAQLNHPNIITIHDAGESEGKTYIVMELTDGESLHSNPPQETTEIVSIACQVSAALDHAHQHGIVHRDLKPENVLFIPDGTVKLSDFGLARSTASRASIKGTISGTVFYMAPELAMGEEYDGRADLYALGVMLYELVCGRLPFVGDDPLVVISQHLHTTVVPPRARNENIHPELDALILRLMSKSMQNRPASAAEVLESLNELDLSKIVPGVAKELTLIDSIVRGRLVGRDSELQALRQHWLDAMQGHVQMVLISGEPGVGKTRLAEELVAFARLHGAEVLRGGCYEFEATVPYMPLTEALRDWVHVQPVEVLESQLENTAAELTKLAPEISVRIGPVEPNPPLAPEQERLRLFDNFARFLSTLASQKGLLLYVDDLHWADQSTLSLLHYILRRSRDEQVLILSAYRDVELDRAHPLAASLVDWNRERLLTRIQLGRLTVEDTADLLAAMFEQESVSEEFFLAIYNETEGNPFFIEEVVKSLIESGQIYREGGEWQREEIEDMAIPQSVKEAIGRRLDGISQESVATLRTAAGLGKIFDFSELAAGAVGDQPDRQTEGFLLDTLEEAISAQLIRIEEGESFVFTHDKIREVLYEELNPIRRRRLHQRLGNGLENLYAGERIKTHVEDLAYHFLQSGDLMKGLDYALQAAEKAERLYAFDEALSYYEGAADSAESLNDSGQLHKIYFARGDIQFQQGLYKRAVADYQKALNYAQHREQTAAVKGKIGAAFGQVSDKRGLEFLEEARRELDRETQTNELAFVLAMLGRYHHYQGQHGQAIEYFERARQLAEPLDDPQTLEFIYAYLSGAYQHQAQFERSNYWACQDVALGERKDYPLGLAGGYEFLAENAFLMGKWADALEYASRDKKIGEQIGAIDRVAWGEFSLGNALYGMGRLEEAREAIQSSFDLSQQIGEQRLLGWLTSMFAFIHADLGDMETAREFAERGLELNTDLGQVIMESWSIMAFAHVSKGASEKQRILDLCNALGEEVETTDSKISRVLLGVALIEALLELGHLDAAQDEVEKYIQLVDDADMHNYQGIARRIQGQIFTDSGESQKAESVYQFAISRFDELGSNIDLARTLVYLAQLYIEQGKNAQALPVLERAVGIFVDCGAKIYEDDCRELLNDLNR